MTSDRIPSSIPFLVLFIVAASFVACSHTPPNANIETAGVSFVHDIVPILENRCVVCHHQANAPNCSGLNLENRQLAFTTGRNSPIIIPGDPDHSPMVTALVASETQPAFMPPVAHRLSDSQLELIKAWIREGAEWPTSSTGTLSRPGS